MSASPSAPPAPAVVPAAPAAAPRSRRKALGIIAVVVLLAGAGYGAYWALALQHTESTDNAYVQGNVVQITPQVPGTVVAILADEADVVKPGQPLVRLDAADAQVALQRAEAQLAQTVREVRTLFANNGTLGAQVALREAELTRAHSEVQRLQADVAKAQDDVNRRQPLMASGAVGKEEFAHASTQLAAARSALASAQSSVAAAQQGVAAAKEQLLAGQTQTEGTTVAQHPGVQRAAAKVREAYLALKRTELPAPLDGVVAKRSVQIGQRVAAGAPLMTVVALDKLWVDANFKEGQLKTLRIGQPAVLTADVYGQKVEFHGTVQGLGAGTGSAFALLPAQNATGNWIKVVQRVPVRIALDAKELASHPLRLGLSMTVHVDVADTSGKMLADVARTGAVAETAVVDQLASAADAQVLKVVQANLGAGAKVDLTPLRVAAVPASGAGQKAH
ncbi:MAG: EmrA/EmrK family multidrug efflux transporter periplasmic adaptor subunit [Burkholderiales bacterium PBB5]|nr:MAG: EmrA/EmrK family multidrug efflux transporter periplasmic adaptor subunit [Burkholderiales bacterium PBB5]